jgi:hypothetical protein
LVKFCTEVSTVLPRCQNTNKEKPKDDNESPEKIASLVKTVRKANTGDELPTVTANCYCPPLYRQWNYVGQTERTNFANGTYETIYYYNCNRVRNLLRFLYCQLIYFFSLLKNAVQTKSVEI